MPRSLVALLAVCVLAAASGCTHARAQTPAPPPPLTTPDPPEQRLVVPVTIPEPAEPAPQPAATQPTAARPQSTAPRSDRSGAGSAAPATPAPPPAPEAAPQVLQTVSNPAELEQRARTQIASAQRDLDKVNTKLLNADGKGQYNSALGFIRNAKDALTIKNFVRAQQLADKAAALASQLARDMK